MPSASSSCSCDGVGDGSRLVDRDREDREL